MKSFGLWISLALGIAILVGTQAQSRDIYRWVDADGTVSYGQTPPQGVDAERIRSSSAPPTPAETASEDADDAPMEAEGGNGMQLSDEQQEVLAQECERARENLAVLENPATRRIQAGEDEVQVLTEERRAALVAENREFIDEWCG
ncbi:hypothetical protein J2T57_002116 [Natronocella acetinitrilica]|uniref:DUF4124 domain-containing protein n=1 Tax=Natronocella acetinitrilica TaxID=414046 RepID=A0AAE3G4F0_9GAMM|nr:DUF4124 domain-containing protein [Natronocella acetinitrilica]MCP1674978.1 hypothetical protein [Natronocella acetinitrilica]